MIRQAGAGQTFSLDDDVRGGVLVLTLGITRVIEQESIDVSIWGSADGVNWGTRPLQTFPQKFYCGTYQTILDLSERAAVKHLRVQWLVNRWGKGESKPLFAAYLFVQAMQTQAVAVCA